MHTLRRQKKNTNITSNHKSMTDKLFNWQNVLNMMRSHHVAAEFGGGLVEQYNGIWCIKKGGER